MTPQQEISKILMMHNNLFAAATGLLILFLGGCSPTHTAGTAGKPAKELAVLSIAQLPGELPVRIKSVKFDGAGDEYEIGNGRDFYLLPGDHTASFSFVAHISGPEGWLIPSSVTTFAGPAGIPLGSFAAGKAYELAPTTEGFDKMIQEGRLSLVREKGK
jgi:hypothetical protein